MLHRVEELFGWAFPPSIELARMTIRRLADRMQWDASPRPAPLVAIQPTGHREPLFFLHGDYLSGGLYCVNLARCLGPDQPFVALTPCGLDGAPTPPSYEAMAARHLEDLRRVRPSGPYRLAGLCNGGLVALEMARLLVAEGQEVDHLLLVAAFPIGAGFSWLRRVLWGAGALAGAATAHQTALFVSLRAAILRLRTPAPSGRLRALLDETRRVRNRIGGIRWWPGAPRPAAVPAEHERFRQRLRAEYLRIDAEYAPRPYPGRITLLWPADDPIEAETAASWWRNVAGRVDVEVVPGTHVTCLTFQVKASAETITRCLRGADALA
jgi:thioesterase domain-containing protein